MRSDRSGRKARISGLAGNEHARNRTLPDLLSVSVCREIHCLTSEFHGKFHAKKPISHESQSNACDIGFSIEIYFGNEFFLIMNRMSFKSKQAHPQGANGKGKKPFQSQLSIASE